MVSHWNLNPACLPIPPCPHSILNYIAKENGFFASLRRKGAGKTFTEVTASKSSASAGAAAPRCLGYHSMKAAICQSKGAGFGGGGRDDNRRRPYGGFRRDAGRPLKDLLRCGGRRPLRRGRAGGMWRSMTAATGRCGRGARGVGDAAPYGGKAPVLSLRDQSADWSWQSVTPVPFFHVFKWQFENTAFFNFQFSILNFQFARNGRQWRSMTAATAGAGETRGVGDAAPYTSMICERGSSPGGHFWEAPPAAIFLLPIRAFSAIIYGMKLYDRGDGI